MAQKKDIGVVRDGAADIIAVPTISDIGIPLTYALVTPDNMPQGAAHKRVNAHPVSRLAAVRGIGVPLNPNDGVTTD